LALPLSLIASALIETIGLTAVLLGRRISEPVTTISASLAESSSAGAAASWAKAGVASASAQDRTEAENAKREPVRRMNALPMPAPVGRQVDYIYVTN
jgi:ribosomal protein L12E/L44/L45/RPP1/RPP2